MYCSTLYTYTHRYLQYIHVCLSKYVSKYLGIFWGSRTTILHMSKVNNTPAQNTAPPVKKGGRKNTPNSPSSARGPGTQPDGLSTYYLYVPVCMYVCTYLQPHPQHSNERKSFIWKKKIPSSLCPSLSDLSTVYGSISNIVDYQGTLSHRLAKVSRSRTPVARAMCACPTDTATATVTIALTTTAAAATPRHHDSRGSGPGRDTLAVGTTVPSTHPLPLLPCLASGDTEVM